MSLLKKEISKNISVVFDNEQSFINEFADSDQIGFVYSFYMGSRHHRVEFEYSNGGFIDKTVTAEKFDLWKSKLANKE